MYIILYDLDLGTGKGLSKVYQMYTELVIKSLSCLEMLIKYVLTNKVIDWTRTVAITLYLVGRMVGM